MKIPSVSLKTGYIPFSGGLDTNTPPIACEAGSLSDSINVLEDVYGGYKRISGYQRFDGKSNLDNIPYVILPVSLDLPVSIGSVVEQGIVSGKVLAIDQGETTTRLLIVRLTSNFIEGNITVSGLIVGRVLDTAYYDSISDKDINKYKSLIEDEFRSEILSVPGKDSTLGGIFYNDSLFVFRNSVADNKVKLFKSSTSGWIEIEFGSELSFTSGNTNLNSITSGTTITGSVSGATANVKMVVLSSGSTLAGDAQGKFILPNQVGTFQAENLQVSSNTICHISGNSQSISIAPGGKFEMILNNFGMGQKVYGVDGVNRAFEFSGSDYSFVFIDRGMDIAPSKICTHANRLFLSFNNSLQSSSFLSPHNWSGLEGGFEINIGDDIRGLCSLKGSDASSCLGVFGSTKLSILYGSSSDTFQLVDFDTNLQTIPHSIQQLQNAWYLGSQGISSLSATQSFGNFQNTSYSQKVSRWLNGRSSNLQCSVICNSTNDYILFFDYGYSLYCKIGQKNGTYIKSFMPVQYPNEVLWVTSGMVNGEETLWFGSDNGYVYQMNKGNSFDGLVIDWYMDLHYVNLKSPAVDKRFRTAEFEAIGQGYSDFSVTYSLSYGSENINQPETESKNASFTVPKWDSFNWDNFTWNGKTLLPLSYRLDGVATNISFKFKGSDNYSDSLRISGVLILYQNLKYNR